MEADIDHYLSFYKKVVPEFTQEELSFVGSRVTVRQLNKNERYLEQGQVQTKIGFVASGLTRVFYMDTKGNEITVHFSPENSFTTDYVSFIRQQPSNYNITAIEPTQIIELQYKHIQEGYHLYPHYERFGRLVIENIFTERQKKLESFLFNTAEERYINFTKTYPGLFNRVSLTHLSSFLGIERQSLTRIRKKLLK